MRRDTTLKRADGQVSAVVDGEVVVMRLSDGVYLTLHDTGSHVWELIEAPTTFGALCDSLATEYDVDLAQCERDTAAYLEGLRDEGVVEIVA